jgi:hypothetical protein
MAGAQLVQVTAKTGLSQQDLSAIWQLTVAPGSNQMMCEDFCLFTHILKHRVNGGDLPGSMPPQERARIFGEGAGAGEGEGAGEGAGVLAPTGEESGSVATLVAMGFEEHAVRSALARYDYDPEKAADYLLSGGDGGGGGGGGGGGSGGGGSGAVGAGDGTAPASPEDRGAGGMVEAPMTPATPGTAQRRMRVFVERCDNIKDGAKLSNTNFSVTLVGASGAALEPAVTTPMAGRTTLNPRP